MSVDGGPVNVAAVPPVTSIGHSGGVGVGGGTGVTTGGVTTGGVTTGGITTGGVTTGGVTTGGVTSGGVTSGGVTTGGVTTGGTTSGGVTAGGVTTGGVTAGGVTAGPPSLPPPPHAVSVATVAIVDSTNRKRVVKNFERNLFSLSRASTVDPETDLISADNRSGVVRLFRWLALQSHCEYSIAPIDDFRCC